MFLLNTLWPFSRLNRLKAENKCLEYRYFRMRAELQQVSQSYELRLQRKIAELDRAEALLRVAHFRSPKTGRLMAKGKLP